MTLNAISVVTSKDASDALVLASPEKNNIGAIIAPEIEIDTRSKVSLRVWNDLQVFLFSWLQLHESTVGMT